MSTKSVIINSFAISPNIGCHATSHDNAKI
nr:MAG TPA: hypothetical protein [Myoviridae sp. ctiIS8]